MARRNLLLFLTLFTVSFSLYSSSITGSFLLNDGPNIVANANVHDLGRIGAYFTDGNSFSVYVLATAWRPLHLLANAVLWWLGGGAPWPYRLYKILLHASVAWLVFVLGARLIRLAAPAFPVGKRRFFELPVTPHLIAFLAAVVFLAHPAFSEAMNYVSATGTQQMAFLYLLGLWFFLAAQEPGVSRGAFAALGAGSLASFICAAMTKEDAASFPLALLAVTIIFRFGIRKNAAVLAGAFLVVLAYINVYALLHPKLEIHYPDPFYPHDFHLTQPWAWLRYALWLLAPWGFLGNYEQYPMVKGAHELRFLAGAGFTVFLFHQARLWLSAKTASKDGFVLLGFAVWWYFLAILPSSSWMVLREPLSEHRAYLPDTLLFPALALGAYHAADSRWIGRAWRWIAPREGYRAELLFLALVVVLGGRTVVENRKWHDPHSFWQSIVSNEPERPEPKAVLAGVEISAGNVPAALLNVRECLALDPSFVPCQLRAYDAYRLAGDIQNARMAIRRASELAPTSAEVQAVYARSALLLDKDPEKAAALALQCQLLTNQEAVDCFQLEMDARYAQGRHGEAAKAARRALELDPANEGIRLRLGQSLVGLKRWGEAERELATFLDRNPGNAAALLSLSEAMVGRADYRAARGRLLELLETDPENEAGLGMLLVVAKKLGDRKLVERTEGDLARIKRKGAPTF